MGGGDRRRSDPDGSDRSTAGLRDRLDRAGPAFNALMRDIRDRGDWDSAFVDALCEPPEQFSFGGVAAHVLTFSAHRRQVLSGALTELGLSNLPTSDPIEWEAAHA